MSFDWIDFLHLSEFLVKRSGRLTEEASLRSATSRAYFAAFCISRNYARDFLRFQPNYTAEDHINLRNLFKQFGEEEFWRSLDRLRQWRNTCDYDDLVGGLNNLSEHALEKATWVTTKVREWQTGK